MAISIELHFIKNLTLDIDIMASQKLQNLEVSEYSPQKVVVNLPNTRVGTGSLVSIGGRLQFENADHKFEATGQVTACDTHPSGKSHRVEIHIRQIDNALWEKFIAAGKAEQNRVDDLFKSMRGE